jgi:holo-[acyl-carrier protein] synthase
MESPEAFDPLWSATAPGSVMCGIDVVEVARIERSLQVAGDAFLTRVYTPAEQALCDGQVARLAAHFAGKEAIVKVLGTGFRGIGYQEVALSRDGAGRPLVQLQDRARLRAEALGLRHWSISLSYSSALVIACVVASS